MIRGTITAGLSTVSLLFALVLVVSLERVRIGDAGIGVHTVASLICS